MTFDVFERYLVLLEVLADISVQTSQVILDHFGVQANIISNQLKARIKTKSLQDKLAFNFNELKIKKLKTKAKSRAIEKNLIKNCVNCIKRKVNYGF